MNFTAWNRKTIANTVTVELASKPGDVRQRTFARLCKFISSRACQLNCGNSSSLGVNFWHMLTAEFQKHLGFLEQWKYILM
jgi:hypothetical protein